MGWHVLLFVKRISLIVGWRVAEVLNANALVAMAVLMLKVHCIAFKKRDDYGLAIFYSTVLTF